MNTPTLTPMSIVATMTVSEENNNTTITIPSPSGVTTPVQAPTTPATNNSTNSSPTQEMDCPFKAIEVEKKLCCMHAPKPAFIVDWRRRKSNQDWSNVILVRS